MNVEIYSKVLMYTNLINDYNIHQSTATSSPKEQDGL